MPSQFRTQVAFSRSQCVSAWSVAGTSPRDDQTTLRGRSEERGQRNGYLGGASLVGSKARGLATDFVGNRLIDGDGVQEAKYVDVSDCRDVRVQHPVEHSKREQRRTAAY